MKWQQGSERLTEVNELGLLHILPYGSLNKFMQKLRVPCCCLCRTSRFQVKLCLCQALVSQRKSVKDAHD